MRSICALTVVGIVAGLAVPAESAITYALDPASPAIDGDITPDDVLTLVPSVYLPGTALGLVDGFFLGVFDNLNALSYGRDPIEAPLFFSVDRVAVGLPGSDVHARAQPGVESAQGDVFVALPPLGSNRLVVPGSFLGLTSGFFGDDLDGLELDTQPAPFVFFSVDIFSVNGSHAGDILVSTGGGSFQVYADILQMGSLQGDDIDALVLMDVTPQPGGGVLPIPNGVLDIGLDRALFSLSTFSPSAFTFTGNEYIPGVPGHLSPADILYTDFTGSFSLFASAAMLGLRADDDVNALDTVVPEPGSFCIWSVVWVGLLGGLRCRFGNPLRHIS